MKLVLGTAQLGLDYGVSNRHGKTPFFGALDILDLAFKSGIKTLDTAYTYGESEKVIGQIMKEKGLAFDIITKTSDYAMDDTDRLICDLQRSLKNL